MQPRSPPRSANYVDPSPQSVRDLIWLAQYSQPGYSTTQTTAIVPSYTMVTLRLKAKCFQRLTPPHRHFAHTKPAGPGPPGVRRWLKFVVPWERIIDQIWSGKIRVSGISFDYSGITSDLCFLTQKPILVLETLLIIIRTISCNP